MQTNVSVQVATTHGRTRSFKAVPDTIVHFLIQNAYEGRCKFSSTEIADSLGIPYGTISTALTKLNRSNGNIHREPLEIGLGYKYWYSRVHRNIEEVPPPIIQDGGTVDRIMRFMAMNCMGLDKAISLTELHGVMSQLGYAYKDINNAVTRLYEARQWIERVCDVSGQYFRYYHKDISMSPSSTVDNNVVKERCSLTLPNGVVLSLSECRSLYEELKVLFDGGNKIA